LVLHGHEQQCKRCGQKLREPILFAEGKRRHNRAFERYVVDLCQIAPIKHVALLLGIGWTLVKEVFKRHLGKRLSKRSLSAVRYIAIDEFSIRKAKQYMTVVLDLESGQVLHAAEGRHAGALIPFLRTLRSEGAKLQAVALDMWAPYLLAVAEVYPEAEPVHDRYHVVSMVNFAIDETRRDMYRDLEGPERGVLKGTRFLLLKGGERLDESGIDHLKRLQVLNEPLYQAYLLKEDLRRFWALDSVEEGDLFLDSWIARAEATGLKHFVRLARTLDGHRKALLAYFNHRITTGPLEGINNKIKVLKRQAYGFRDMDYFRLRLAFIHESTPAFAG
jgi:transposase